MSQFYVGSEAAAQRCQESQDHQQPISISGQTEEGTIEAFTGTVQSVDRDDARPPNRRWRITMRDE